MDDLLAMLIAEPSVSGQRMCAQLGVTRAAIWKRIEKLRRMGVVIDSVGRNGYALRALPDVPFSPVLAARLTTRRMGRPAFYYETIGSTNAEAKRLAREGASEGTLVIAAEQTDGRGRRGREWHSASEKGVWCTTILRPAVPAERVPSLAMVCALAVADAIADCCGQRAGIKWPNDVIIGGKKVCGILLELSADMERVDWVVAGIGINGWHTQADFPPDIADTATSLLLTTGTTPERVSLIAALMRALEARYDTWSKAGLVGLMDDYAAMSVTLGQPVCVIATDQTFEGVARRMDETGALWVALADGTERRVLAADVSVRGVMGA